MNKKKVIHYAEYFTTLILALTVSGFVYKMLWHWFITPTIGLPGINWAEGIGLTYVVRAFSYGTVAVKPEKVTGDIQVDTLLYNLKGCVIALLAGFILHFFTR